MPHVDPWSIVLLAIVPAITLAAFASRFKRRAVKTAVLICAATPSLAIAYLVIDSVLHRHAGPVAALIFGGMSACALGFTAFTGYFGHRLLAGKGLVVMAAMGALPVVAFLALLLRAQAPSRQPQHEPTSAEKSELAHQLAYQDRQQMASAQREASSLKKALRKCARNLSAKAGQAAAKTHHREGKTQFIMLKTFQQESVFTELPELNSPGKPQSDIIRWYKHYTADDLKIRVKGKGRAGEFDALVIDPPYHLWSDPWVRSPAIDFKIYIEPCNVAVRAYSVAYNQTMLMLN